MTPFEFGAVSSQDLHSTIMKTAGAYDFVEHYTSPRAALNILRSKQIWFTNISNMNDISEMVGGCRIAYQTLMQQADALFVAFPDFAKQVLEDFDRRFIASYKDSYAFCLTGHDASQAAGRLEMWRGYGADGVGVCLVLKRAPIIQDRMLDFPINWIPMICEPPNTLASRVTQYLQRVSTVLAENQGLLREHRQEIVNITAHTLLLMGVAHKHIQFSYEREIRLIHMKAFQVPTPGRMLYDAEVIRGTLQPLLKVNLADYSDLGVPGTQLEDLLERILIGPSSMAEMQAKALDHVLKANGLPNVPVDLCDIPYRSSARPILE